MLWNGQAEFQQPISLSHNMFDKSKSDILFCYCSPGNTENLSTRLTEIYHELEAIDADKAPARAGVILAGLGFTPQMQSQCTKHVNTTLAYTSVTAKLYYKILFDLLWFCYIREHDERKECTRYLIFWFDLSLLKLDIKYIKMMQV